MDSSKAVERVLDLLEGRLDEAPARDLEDAMSADPRLAALREELEALILLLGMEDVPAVPHATRQALARRLAAEASVPRAEELEEWFRLSRDSSKEPAPAGVRRMGGGVRMMVFKDRDGRLDIELSWAPGSQGEPGVLKGQVLKAAGGEEPGRWKIKLVPAGEQPRVSPLDADGFFVFDKVPQGVPLSLSLVDPATGEERRLPTLDF